MLIISSRVLENNTYVENTVATLSIGNIITILSIVAAVYLAFYVLRSIGIYKLAKGQGVKNAFIAFIPFAWFYTACKVIGNARVFGSTMEKFAVWACVLFSVAAALPLIYNFLLYFPYLGYLLQGGTVTLTSGYDGTFISAGSDFINPFDGSAVQMILRILYVLNYLFRIVEIFVTVTVYIALFKKFWPEHYILAAVLSFFGFFPIFVFAVRNRKAVDFNEYIRRRFYGSGYTPYGRGGYGNDRGQGGTGNPYGNPYNGGASDGKDEPFGEFKDRPDEPFGEFSDDKKDDGNDEFKQ